MCMRRLLLVIACGCSGATAVNAEEECDFREAEIGGIAGGDVVLAMVICASAEAPAYVDGDFVRITGPDGRSVPVLEACPSLDCASCPRISFCDRFPLVVEVQSRRVFFDRWNGRVPTGDSTCAENSVVCRFHAAVDAGTYAADFCYGTSRSMTPRHCIRQSFDAPFDGGVVLQRFRL